MSPSLCLDDEGPGSPRLCLYADLPSPTLLSVCHPVPPPLASAWPVYNYIIFLYLGSVFPFQELL